MEKRERQKDTRKQTAMETGRQKEKTHMRLKQSPAGQERELGPR